MSTIRNTLVAQVVALLQPIDDAELAQVELMPDHPSLMRFRHGKAAIFVGYHSTRYTKPSSSGGSLQDSVVTFDIAILARKLNGPDGTVNYVDMVLEKIHGQRLAAGGSPIYLVSDEYVDQKNGVWRYDMTAAITLPQIAPDASDPTNTEHAPAFKWALLENETDGDTSVGEDPDA